MGVFANKIQLEYYGVNIYVSIEVIEPYHLSDPYQPSLFFRTGLSFSSYCVSLLFYDDRKQGPEKTAAQRKLVIKLLKKDNLFFKILVPYGRIQMVLLRNTYVP